MMLLISQTQDFNHYVAKVGEDAYLLYADEADGSCRRVIALHDDGEEETVFSEGRLLEILDELAPHTNQWFDFRPIAKLPFRLAAEPFVIE